MSKVYDEELDPPGAIGLSTKERELLNREARLNDAIDARLRCQIDKDPRIAWWLYPVVFLYNLAVHAIFFSTASLYMYAYDYQSGPANSYEAHFTAIMHFLPLLCSTLTDSYLSKWWTLTSAILVLFISTIAMLVVNLPALATSIHIIFAVQLITGIAIAFTAPTIVAFGGDQFLATQGSGRARLFVLLDASSILGLVVINFADPVLNRCSHDSWCFLFSRVLALCSLLLTLPILLIGHQRFRTVPPTCEFIPFKMVKAIAVGAKRYWTASPADRAVAGHWLNFVAKDYGSLFVQEVHDLGLALVPVALPIYLSTMVSEHFQLLVTYGMSRYIADSQDHHNENFPWPHVLPFYCGLALAPILAFGVFPLMERRGWNVSPHRRLGVGLVCGLIALVIAAIVDKVLKSNGDPVWSDGYESPAVCQNCVHYAVMAPQFFFQTFYIVLVTPASINIAYDEVGRHFRTFSVAISLAVASLAKVLAHSSVHEFDSEIELARGVSNSSGKYIGIGTGGLAFYFAAVYFYTPRRLRPAINAASRMVKDAEFFICTNNQDEILGNDTLPPQQGHGREQSSTLYLSSYSRTIEGLA